MASRGLINFQHHKSYKCLEVWASFYHMFVDWRLNPFEQQLGKRVYILISHTFKGLMFYNFKKAFGTVSEMCFKVVTKWFRAQSHRRLAVEIQSYQQVLTLHKQTNLPPSKQKRIIVSIAVGRLRLNVAWAIAVVSHTKASVVSLVSLGHTGMLPGARQCPHRTGGRWRRWWFGKDD